MLSMVAPAVAIACRSYFQYRPSWVTVIHIARIELIQRRLEKWSRSLEDEMRAYVVIVADELGWTMQGFAIDIA